MAFTDNDQDLKFTEFLKYEEQLLTVESFINHKGLQIEISQSILNEKLQDVSSRLLNSK